MRKNGVQKLYFVVETKGTTKEDGLASKQLFKTKFVRKRFEDVGGAAYILADKHDSFCERV